MTNFTNRTFVGVATLLATVVTVAAATPLRAEPVSTPVVYGDLNLSSDAGRSTLNRRIGHAADIVCGPRDRINTHAVTACRKTAIATAHMNVRLAQVNADRQDTRIASR